MRKYIHLAKYLKPKLSEEACEAISIEYSRLRSQDNEAHVARTQPVTARSLETLIRLSTAHAKARMAKTVTVDDAHAAIELVQFAYFKKVLEKRKRQRSSSEEEEVDGEIEIAATAAIRSSKRVRTEQSEEIETESEPMVDAPVDPGDLTQRATITAVGQPPVEEMVVEATITTERLMVFQNLVQVAFRKMHEQSIALPELLRILNRDVDEPFAEGEVTAAIAHMTDLNGIMVADDIVFLI